MTSEHKKYLKNIKLNKFFVILTQILLITIFFISWQLLSSFNIINSFIFSSPQKIVQTLISLIKSNTIFIHIWTTIYETAISFVLGSILGMLIATMLWWNRFLAKVFNPFLIIVNSLPKVALGPIIIIWTGANIKSIILMALLISTIITVINIYEGFINTDPTKIKLLTGFKANKLQMFFKLILPNSYNNIISTMQINISMSLIGVITGEFLVSKSGIGYLIMYGSQVFNLNLVITSIIILALLATIMYYVIIYIEKKLIKSN